MKSPFKEFKISDETKVRITNISVVQRKFVKNNVLNVKSLTPVVCRDHDRETEKDKYVSYCEFQYLCFSPDIYPGMGL